MVLACLSEASETLSILPIPKGSRGLFPAEMMPFYGRATVGAALLPLREQVVAQFRPEQRAVLILQALNIRVLKHLEVKTNQLKRDRPNRAEAAQTLHPGEHVLESTPEGWDQPACWATAIAPARLPIPGMPVATTTAHLAPSEEATTHLFSSMAQFCGPHHLPGGIVDDCQASGFAAWINFQAYRLRVRFGRQAVEDQHEGIPAIHGSLPRR
jgi:hypothetical protein